MYQLDPIEESNLLSVYETLRQIQIMLEGSGQVSAGALLFDDDEPLVTHVAQNLESLAELMTEILREKRLRNDLDDPKYYEEE
jgi:hypothetical protein